MRHQNVPVADVRQGGCEPWTGRGGTGLLIHVDLFVRDAEAASSRARSCFVVQKRV